MGGAWARAESRRHLLVLQYRGWRCVRSPGEGGDFVTPLRLYRSRRPPSAGDRSHLIDTSTVPGVRWAVLAIGVIGAVMACSSAQAAYVGSGDARLSYNAEPGEHNDVTITIEGDNAIVTDTGALMKGCDIPVAEARHRAVCAGPKTDYPGATPRFTVDVYLEDGNDVV